MADVTNQKLGGTGTSTAVSAYPLKTFNGVIDIAKGVSDNSYVKTEQFDLLTIPANATILHFDARITEALVLGTTGTTDIGTTAADPDEFVDAQTTTAVGNFGAIAATTLAASDTERTLFAEFNNSGGTVDSGKIAYTVVMTVPAVETEEKARPRTYTNVTG